MKQKLISFISMIVLAAALTACGSSTTGEMEAQAQQIEGADRAPIVDVEMFEKVEAVYVGQNDNSSVELIVDGQPNTYRLDDLEDKDFSQWKKNEKAIIDYVIKTQQVKDGEIKGSYLTRISKVK